MRSAERGPGQIRRQGGFKRGAEVGGMVLIPTEARNCPQGVTYTSVFK